jgi:hypothetical protein
MLKKTVTSFSLAFALAFTGCGDSEGEKRLEAQDALDSGNYESVISMLEPVSESTSSEEYNLLASAYMAKAGFTLGDIVQLMDASNDTGSDGFASFAASIANERTDSSLEDLNKAVNYYKDMLDDVSCSDTNLTSTEKDVCFFIGLSSTVKTATTLSYLGDLTNFGSDSLDEDYELAASACAMQYAYDQVGSADCAYTMGDLNVTFDSNKSYDSFKVTVDDDLSGTEYFYLMTRDSATAPIEQTIITDGYCGVDFTTCTTANNTDCFACPVNQDADAEELTVATILVDVLNDGLDAVIGAVGGSSGDTDSIAADIEEYKQEVGGADGEVSVQEIIDYINAQN